VRTLDIAHAVLAASGERNDMIDRRAHLIGPFRSLIDRLTANAAHPSIALEHIALANTLNNVYTPFPGPSLSVLGSIGFNLINIDPRRLTLRDKMAGVRTKTPETRRLLFPR
jgi:hypothetical protein